MNDRRPVVRVSDDLGLTLFVIFLLVMCVGDPDLFDVLQEWCRRYLEVR